MDNRLENFFESLKNASMRLLMTDYDGTLAPFVVDRDKAVPYPGIIERLDQLIASHKTDVVIISGRAINDITPLLKLKKHPEIWGSHGWERLTSDGDYILKKADKHNLAKLTAAREYIYESKLEQYLEEKPVSLAIHHRGLDEKLIIDIEAKIKHNWDRIASESNLVYDTFDGGLELKLPGFNKGHVVNEILGRYQTPPSAAYLGDDLTDEDAFRVLENKALRVHVKAEEVTTAADVRIVAPDGLLGFLDRWIEIDTAREK